MKFSIEGVLEASSRQKKPGGYVKGCPNGCRWQNPPWWDMVAAIFLNAFFLFIPALCAIPMVIWFYWTTRGECPICHAAKIPKEKPASEEPAG